MRALRCIAVTLSLCAAVTGSAMADALAYATAKLGPVAIVDVATLTGAMKVSLGQRTGGYFANHEGLAAAIAAGGKALAQFLFRRQLVPDGQLTRRNQAANLMQDHIHRRPRHLANLRCHLVVLILRVDILPGQSTPPIRWHRP